MFTYMSVDMHDHLLCKWSIRTAVIYFPNDIYCLRFILKYLLTTFEFNVSYTSCRFSCIYAKPLNLHNTFRESKTDFCMASQLESITLNIPLTIHYHQLYFLLVWNDEGWQLVLSSCRIACFVYHLNWAVLAIERQISQHLFGVIGTKLWKVCKGFTCSQSEIFFMECFGLHTFVVG